MIYNLTHLDTTLFCHTNLFMYAHTDYTVYFGLKHISLAFLKTVDQILSTKTKVTKLSNVIALTTEIYL